MGAHDGPSPNTKFTLVGSRPQKHSLTLKGHRTSVSLEDAFWAEFRMIADRRQRSVNVLAAEIDALRGTSMGLASAMRLFILDDLKQRLGGR